MAKQKKRRVKRKPEPTVMDEDPETKAIRDWLRMADKPLAKEEGDRDNTEPRDE